MNFGKVISKLLRKQIGNCKLSRSHRRSTYWLWSTSRGKIFTHLSVSHLHSDKRLNSAVWESHTLLKTAANGPAPENLEENCFLGKLLSSLQVLDTIKSHLHLWEHSLSMEMSKKMDMLCAFSRQQQARIDLCTSKVSSPHQKLQLS